MKKKEHWQLTDQELQALSREFEQEFIFEKTRPLSPAEKARWRRIQGRAKNGQTQKRISISLEPALVERANHLARKRRMSRSQLFTKLLKAVLATAK